MDAAARWGFLAIALTCAALVGGALYMQHGLGMAPCPLCILQRIMFIAVGVGAVIAFAHNPGPRGRRAYAGGVGLLALGGLALAARHVWLIHNPEAAADCMPGLGYMFRVFPFTEALSMALKGTAECAEQTDEMLGMALPEWALVWFAVLLAATAALLLQRRPPGA